MRYGLGNFSLDESRRDSKMYQSDESLEILAERNERSTPRSFILPATPGVAFEQEDQQAGTARQAQMAKCVEALRVLGYDSGDSTTFLNAKLVEAVYTYQLAHKLPRTGRFDALTMEMLKCVSREYSVAR